MRRHQGTAATESLGRDLQDSGRESRDDGRRTLSDTFMISAMYLSYFTAALDVSPALYGLTAMSCISSLRALQRPPWHAGARQ